MKWKTPPTIKIYEALGAISDGRVEVEGNVAKVYSSSRGKYYDVTYDPVAGAIMANDNGSYWKGYLGYPSIALLMLKQVLPYDLSVAMLLKDIPWKDINQKHKNNFDKTLSYVLGAVLHRGGNVQDLERYVEDIKQRVQALELSHLGPRAQPPEGY